MLCSGATIHSVKECGALLLASCAPLKNGFLAMRRIRENIFNVLLKKSEATTKIIALKDIPFESHCEHHLAPIIGRARGLSAPQSRRWHLKGGEAGGRLCQTISGAGKNDRRNCRLFAECAEALRSRGGH